jgi:flagellar L-ring protein precursor FlgH
MALALAAALGMVGCAAPRAAVSPTLSGDLERLQQDLDILPPFPMPARSSGSLWTDGGPGAAMVRDTRAFRVNDLVQIRIVESSSGSNAATTDLTRTSEQSWGAGVAFGLENPNAGAGDFNLSNVLDAQSESKFNGDGSTKRSNSLQGFITTRVMRVLPNGDLVIAGQKTLMVNRERQILTLVGTVRTVDINSANQTPSSKVGDLTVRMWGHGEIDANARQGWFIRVMNRLWPF